MFKPQFSIIIYTPQEFNHASYIQTGFYEMAAMGLIKVNVKLDVSKKLGRTIVNKTGVITYAKNAHPKTSFYKLIDHRTQRIITFAIDLYDLADHFSTVALNQCDYIFKRNYDNAFIKHLPEYHQTKIKKMNLTFLVRSQSKKHDLLYFTGNLLANLNVNFKIDRYLIKRLARTFKNELKHWNFVKKCIYLNEFEKVKPSNSLSVFFQTRCFPHNNGDDVMAIHEQRYEIIKLLKTTFPDVFMGGFVPSKIAESLYPDALTNVPSEPQQYLTALKNAGIVVYTRGLANSPAWKMAEYLSQGKVIIAERLTTELLVPLQHGVEVLFFDNLEEMIALVTKVLKDDQLRSNLSINARKYFDAHVHPVSHMKQLIYQLESL